MNPSSPAAEVDRLTLELMEKLKIPGVALGALAGGEEHVACFGVTSVDHPLAVDDETAFQFGSTTKTVTATAVLRLVEDGKLVLDEPVQTYLPTFRLADLAASGRITIRHLLTHTPGFESDLFDDTGSGDDALERFVERMTCLEQLAPPGTLWGYTNAGFSLLGRVIEVVTGVTYRTAIRELVLRPLDMTRSFFAAEDAITHRVAIGHRVGPDGPHVTTPWALDRNAEPAGGLAVSVADQLRYARFHLGLGPEVLRPETLQLMQSPAVEAGGGYAAQCGLGWLLQRTPGVIAHGGSTNGQESAFVIVPDKAFAFAVCTNADSGVVLQREVTKLALRNLAGVASARPHLVPLDAPALHGLVGHYRGSLYDVAVTEGSAGLTLSLEPRPALVRVLPESEAVPPLTLEIYEGQGFRVVGGALRGATGEFLPDEAGTTRWLRLNGRLHARMS